MERLQIGDRIRGFAGGFFGRDSHGDKVVEAVGPDWVVAREQQGGVVFSSGHDILFQLWKYSDRACVTEG